MLDSATCEIIFASSEMSAEFATGGWWQGKEMVPESGFELVTC